MVLEVFNDIGFEIKVSKETAIDDTLHCTGDFAQHSEFLSTKTNLLALDFFQF